MDEVIIDEQGRPEPPATTGELETLVGFLDFQRATLEWKTAGLDDEQLRRPLDGHPSGMTLGGLLAHLAFVENYWFGITMDREPLEPWASADWQSDPDLDWHLAATTSGEELRRLWTEAVTQSRQVQERHPDPGEVFTRFRSEEQVSLRWVLVHMVEEYARHNGHADLLREQVDGVVGE